MTLRARRRKVNPGLELAAAIGAPTHVRPDAAGRAPDSDRDPAYLVRVREMWCLAGVMEHHICGGVRVAHHAGRHGVGRRCTDLEAICLCATAHDDLHAHRGPFKHMTGSEIREQENRWIAFTQQYLGVSR